MTGRRTTTSLLIAIVIIAIAAIILAAAPLLAPTPPQPSSTPSSGQALSSLPEDDDNGGSAANGTQAQQQQQQQQPSLAPPGQGAAAATTGSLPSFAEAANLTENLDDSVYGQVMAAGASVYVVWQESVEDTENSNYDIFFKRSLDGGRTFSQDAANLSRNPGFSEHPQLALALSGDGKKTVVHVSWVDDTSGVEQVLFKKSLDGGATFGGPTEVLSSPDMNSFNHEMAASGDSVYVVWQQEPADGNGAAGSIVLRASHDGGNSFEGPVIIAGNSSLVDPDSFPKVAAYGNDVHVVWSVTAGGNQEQQQQQQAVGLYYVKSSDGGRTFSPAVRLDGGRSVGEAQVAAYGDDVHVVWGGLHSLEVDGLYHVKSSDGGATFTEPANIGAGGVVVKDPLNVELAIMPAATMAATAAAGQEQGRPSSSPHYSVYVATQAAAPSPKGNEEILLLSSHDGGDSFLKEAVNLSNNDGISECPSISISGSDIFVTWEDLTTGNHEIFYARGGA